MEKTSFGQRLRLAFKNAKNAEIARKIGVGETAVTNYMAGRVPDLEKLLKIKASTNCDLDWLLTGDESRNVEPEPAKAEVPNILDMAVLSGMIREIAREEIANSLGSPEDVVSEREPQPDEHVTMEPVEMILAPVVAHIGPGVPLKKPDPKEEIRKSLVTDEKIKEMEARLRPRRRRTG